MNPGLGQHRLDGLDAGDPAAIGPAPQDENRRDATNSEPNHMLNPGLGQHRLDRLDAEDLGPASQPGSPISDSQTYCAAPWGPCVEP